MTTPDGIYVLYKDVPRRRYRRIAAKSEESPSHLQFFVEITEGEPFDFENTDVQIFPCSTRSEAMAKAEQERESSLNSDWREYPTLLCDRSVCSARIPELGLPWGFVYASVAED